MKKITIGRLQLWYDRKLGFLFYDYKRTRQFPKSILTAKENLLFLNQINKQQ